MIKIQGSFIWLPSTYERQLRGASGSIEISLRAKSIQKTLQKKNLPLHWFYPTASRGGAMY